MLLDWKKTALGMTAVILSVAVCACSRQEPAAPTQEEIITLPVPVQTTAATDPKESVEELRVVMEPGQLYTLDSYPNLKRVDLSGSTCYAAIWDFIEKHPNLDVTFTVDLGGTAVLNQATSAELPGDAMDYDILMENLAYLPDLTTLSLPGVTLTSQQIEALLERYPDLALEYTVELFGSTYDQEVTSLDLTAMTSGQVDEAVQKLGLLTHLTDVSLSSGLDLEDVARLQDSAPRTVFHYSFSLFGKSLSTTDETVEYKNQSIGNEGEADIRRALAVLDNCSRFVLDNCGLDNEVLAGIREDFRDGPKVVWRVYFGVDSRYNELTDTDTLRAVYNVTDTTCGPMRYCEDVKYMDIGHNEYLTDLSFVGYMPNIEVLIASEAAVVTLPEGMANCKKLTWLELAYCHKLENIDALAGCEGLRFLNISYSKVSSYISLDSLPLERFVCLSPRATTKEQNTFVALHDGCRTVFYGYSNPWTPWRYDDNGNTFNKYYKEVVREAFNYDYLETLLPKE